MPLRAAQLVRIGTDVYGCVRRKGAPYALHYPAVSLCPSRTRLRQSKPTGYNETPPLCPFGLSGPPGP